LTLAAAAANRDNLFGSSKIDPLDSDGYTQQLGIERQGQVLLYHSEETGALLVLAVSVDDRLLNQLSQMLFAGWPGRLSCFRAGSVPPILLHLKINLSGDANFHAGP
jgi:hypothetical protein